MMGDAMFAGSGDRNEPGLLLESGTRHSALPNDRGKSTAIDLAMKWDRKRDRAPTQNHVTASLADGFETLLLKQRDQIGAGEDA